MELQTTLGDSAKPLCEDCSAVATVTVETDYGLEEHYCREYALELLIESL